MATQGGFFSVPLLPAETSSGTVELPILYYEVSNVIAYLALDAGAAKAMLDGTGLTPVRLPTGQAVGAISFYEYRRTSIGTYNEVGTAIAVLPPGAHAGRVPLLDLLTPLRRRTIGFFIVDLPVTTQIANDAGRELWGYPKFVTSLPFHLETGLFGARFGGAVVDPVDGTRILSLDGRLLPGVPAPGLDFVLYSLRDGRLLRTVVDVSARTRLAAGVSLRLEAGSSRHPMARRLRDLGAEGRPLLVQYTDDFQLRLNAGVPWEAPKAS